MNKNNENMLYQIMIIIIVIIIKFVLIHQIIIEMYNTLGKNNFENDGHLCRLKYR